MRRFIPLASAALAALALGPARAAEPVRDVCTIEIKADVAKRFGQKVTRIEYQFSPIADSDEGGGEIETGWAFVYTDVCPGYHQYYLYASEFDCRIAPHYGTPPDYIQYQASLDGC